jgi:hypothetical protein
MPQSGCMRLVVPCLAAALALTPGTSAAHAQNVAKYDFDVRDVYGNPTRAPETVATVTANGRRSFERTESINGTRVKLESVTEKIEQKDARTRVTERTIQRFDPNGNPAGLERQLVTELKNDDGTLSSTTQKFRSDLNGSLSLAEKAETVQRKTSPTTVESSTVVSRPTVNGSFSIVERDESVKNASAEGKWLETRAVWRNGENGFYQANKVVTEHAEQNNRATENSAEYEVGSSGALELHQQLSVETLKQPDGSSVTSIDYFNRHAPGYAVTNDQQLALRAREIREHRAEGSQRTVDTLSIQHPTITDPTRLGPPKLVSETVCTGVCK